MTNLNQIILVGRLGQEPECRYFESGSMVTKITLAVNRRRRKSPACWFDVQLWDKLGEIAGQYTHKGSLIAVTGELKFEEWSDKQTGVARTKPIVRATNLELLSSSKQQSPDANDNSENF